jgi:EAL domain-containing protein (putative c-di-GMP-specific phosphodiesterase class I)
VGVEALARWTHPTRGPIPPDEFIVQAEKSQDIYRLTLFVMDQAIRLAAQLRERGAHINMSVNLSATLLDHERNNDKVDVEFDGGRLTLRKKLPGSAAFLVKFEL